ncbi:MAG: relaxase/mobilization nuclease domain-containing protein [Janthinobacterium lividum]
MVSRTTIGKSFDGLVRYQYVGRRDQPVDKQAEILASAGVSEESAAEMISDFNLGKAVNPRLGYPVWHTSLSFNPTDAARLDSTKMREIAEGYLQKMGLNKTQYVIVRHHDQPDNQHLHIIANRVDYDGKTIADGRNFYRSKLALQELIVEHGLTPIKGQRPELQHPERLHGTDLARKELLTIVNQALAAETQRSRLLATLQAAGVGVEERFDKAGKATGISFEKDGYSFKGSELGRHLSSAGIDKQLAANELKQQAAVTLEITTASLPPASVTLGAGLGITPASPEKAESVKLPEVATGQPPVAVRTLAATIVRETAEGGETSAVAQPDTAERDRLKEQAVAAVAAFQREKELIAGYEEQANRAYRERDLTRFAELEYETIPAAKKRLDAYETAAKAIPIGSELLAKQKERHADKVQKEECPPVEEKSSVSVPISKQQMAISLAVEPVVPVLPAASSLVSSAVPEVPIIPLSVQRPPVVAIVPEEVPVSKAPPETTPAVAPRQAVAAQAAGVIQHVTVRLASSKKLLPPSLKRTTSMPGPATGLPSSVPIQAQKVQSSVPVAATLKPPVGAAVSPEVSKPPVGSTEATKSATNNSPLGQAVPAVPTTVVPPPVVQPPRASEKVAEQLPAMSLAERLISALPDLSVPTIAPVPVVVPEATWQHGIIRMRADEKRTSEERLSAVRAALLKAGANVGEPVPPTPGRNMVALLPYSFDPTQLSLEAVNRVLNNVHALTDSKVQERPHTWHQPGMSAGNEPLDWPEREGQFNQAHILMKDLNRGQPDAEVIAADFRKAGAHVSEIKRDDRGHLVIQVSYHTYAPGIDTINKTLESAASKSTGVEVQESKQNHDARYEVAIQIIMKQQAKENDTQQGR